MKKFNFTIVELLVVIAIILILVGMLFPAVSKVREKAKITKAKGEMTSIVTAIKAYESTFGMLPCFGPTGTTYHALQATANVAYYRYLIGGLSCAPGPGEGVALTVSAYSNTRKTRFLDAPSNYTNSTAGTANVSGSNSGAKVGDYKDPWGNLYQIYLDTNCDGMISTTSAGTAGFDVVAPPACITLPSTNPTFNGSILIYSLGPNGIDDGGRNAIFGEKPTAAGSKPFDDICSWR